MNDKLTSAEHDPKALSILTTALAPVLDGSTDSEIFSAACSVFGALHQAGMRIVPVEALGA